MKKKNFLKKAVIVSGFLTFSAFANAQQIIIVDNNNPSPETYTNLQTAIDNAPSGSTIYVQPSITTYDAVTINNKSLKIIGRSSNEPGYESKINGIVFENGSSNSEIHGLEIGNVSIYGDYNTGNLQNIKIKECDINGLVIGYPYVNYTSPLKNITVEGSRIYGLTFYNNATDLIVRNNIISYITVNASNYNNFFVSQNIFTAGAPISSSSTSILNISNSIFIGNSTYGSATLNVYGKVNFQNCLTYDYGGGTFTINDQGNDGHTSVFTNMKYNQDPKFLNINPNLPNTVDEYSIANNGSYNPVADNLKLQANSPAIGAGQNAEDLGIHYNYDYRNFGNPFGYPVLKITNAASSVPAGGNLQVTINAKAQ